jgi:predicted permease
MLKNYFKIAWRTLLRHKGYTAINIAGLTLGIAASILIFTIISFHLSFDTFHHNKDRIYRVLAELHDEKVTSYPSVPQPFGKAFRNDYNLAEKTARVVTWRESLIALPGAKEVKKFQEAGIAYAEPAFFDIFNFPLVEGDIKTALNSPNHALITQSIAKKYFGSEDAMGKTIQVNNKSVYTITGILRDIPPNTDRKQEIYLSYDNLKDENSWLASDSSWASIYSGSMCFLLLRPGVTQAQVENVFPAFSNKYFSKKEARANQYKLQPLSDMHFNTSLDGTFDRKYITALLLIGLFLIVTACVNFINMATAQALQRSKEVGIRKVLGSLRGQLFWQFIAETTLITLLAGLLAYGVAVASLPSLNNLTHSQMTIRLFASWSLPLFIVLVLALVIFFSGSYPGLILSRFQPIEALKSKLSQAHIGGFSLRRVLVVTQFTISQLLVIGMIIIGYQMHYSMNADLGFDKEAIVNLPLPVTDLVKMHSLRDRLAALPGVEKLSLCMQPPAARQNNTTNITYDHRAENELWSLNLKPADDQYIPTFGLQLVAGRNFYPSDTARGIIVNEKFVKDLNLTSPQAVIGKMVVINDLSGPIIGVVKDFHNYSLHEDIDAVALVQDAERYGICSVKIDPRQVRTFLTAAEKIWNNTYPQYLYSYAFLDDRIAEFYFMDKILLTLVEVFAGIAIFISSLGLYGLVSFMAVRKTKEIGVRKVLGARLPQILWLFGREFSVLILIAFVIAAPLAWLATHAYLQDFKYRIHTGPLVFLAAIAFTFVIAALTVGYRSLRAATANPAKSLKSE